MQSINNVNLTAQDQPMAPRIDPRVKYLERRMLEAFDELWDGFVDPAEAVNDVDGTPWSRLGGGLLPGGTLGMPFGNEQQIAQIRDQCRALAVSNEFAINGHENRISYIVGSGHAYARWPRRGWMPNRWSARCKRSSTSSSA